MGECGTISPAPASAQHSPKKLTLSGEGERTSVWVLASLRANFATYSQREATARYGVRAGDAQRLRTCAHSRARRGLIRTGPNPRLRPGTRERPRAPQGCARPAGAGSCWALVPERLGWPKGRRCPASKREGAVECGPELQLALAEARGI